MSDERAHNLQEIKRLHVQGKHEEANQIFYEMANELREKKRKLGLGLWDNLDTKTEDGHKP